MNILITGSQGYIGQHLAKHLSTEHQVYGLDIRDASPEHYHYEKMDIRDPALAEKMQQWNISHVVHLASIVQSTGDRQLDYDIDVKGTQNVLDACLKAGVSHITITSSGAAYGYYADNPEWIVETDAIRGNEIFSYSHHKRLVEEMLCEYAQQHPQLQQLILRPGTVLGANTNNLITNLFKKDRLLTIGGSKSPFVFIWDQDVVAIILKGVTESITGKYNLAGDGALSIQEIAKILGKPTLTLPAWLLKTGLAIGKALGLTQYGPQQLDFLRYRPVLSNKALKETFGYTPQKTSQEVFELFARGQGMLP